MFMLQGPIELYMIEVEYMCLTFGKGAFMESYVMDHVIKYWKEDADMNLVYRSGERVLFLHLYSSR